MKLVSAGSSLTALSDLLSRMVVYGIFPCTPGPRNCIRRVRSQAEDKKKIMEIHDIKDTEVCVSD